MGKGKKAGKAQAQTAKANGLNQNASGKIKGMINETVQKAVASAKKQLSRSGSSKAKSGAGGRVSMPLSSAYRLPNARRPRFQRGSRTGSVRVDGCEVIRKVADAQNFAYQGQFSLNPSNESLFPFLSGLADLFESYSVNKFDAEYYPQCPLTKTGSFMHYFDYDPGDSAVVDELTLLGQKTRDAVPVHMSSVIRADCKEIHRNRQEFFTQSNQALTNGQAANVAEIRQNNAGTLRFLVHSCSDDDEHSFVGYYAIEYDFEFHNYRPRRQFAAVWSDVPKVLAASESQYCALGEGEGQVGLPGGPVTGASTSILSTLEGFLVGCKQVYEAGEWIFDLYGETNSTAADAPKREEWSHCGHSSGADDAKAPATQEWSATVSLQDYGTNDDHEAHKLLRPNTANEVLIYLTVYDVSDGVIDPNFPVSNTGMTVVSSQAQSWVTASAVPISFSRNVSVPAGSQYMIRPAFTTTGTARTISDVTFTAIAQTTNAP